MDHIRNIDIELIDVPEDRLRLPDPDAVGAIALSMDERGLMHPITVAAPKKGERFRLIAGLHRLTAARQLGWSEIAASVFAGKALEARLLEIDENLFHRPLSPLDRAAHLAERQRIYHELYPETRPGAAGATARWHATDKLSFASEAAEKLGVSERDVQRSIARYTRIAPDVRAQIALTWIADKGTELDALARLEPAQQRKAVTALLNRDAASVRQAVAAMSGARPAAPAPDEAEYDRLMEAWRRAGARAKERFLAELERQRVISASQRAA